MDPLSTIAGRSRETRIRRDARGHWWNGEDAIDHPQVTRAFDGWIRRAADGRYCLENDINWAYVTIEGPPYFVRHVQVRDGAAILQLSGDRVEALDPSTLREGPDGALYCDVEPGLPAVFDRYALEALAREVGGEDEEGPYLALGGSRVRPTIVTDPLSS